MLQQSHIFHLQLMIFFQSEMCLKKGRAGAAVALLRLAKSCDRRIWWFQTPLRQFEGELHQHIFRALESKLNGPITERDAFYQAMCLLDMQPGM
jgi:activating signal cointegrator complex subunit 3